MITVGERFQKGNDRLFLFISEAKIAQLVLIDIL
jgi:hypothetical protein